MNLHLELSAHVLHQNLIAASSAPVGSASVREQFNSRVLCQAPAWRLPPPAPLVLSARASAGKSLVWRARSHHKAHGCA